MQTDNKSAEHTPSENLPATTIHAVPAAVPVVDESVHRESHTPVNAARNTGRYVLLAVLLLACLLGGVYFVVAGHRSKEEARLATETNIEESTAPAVSVVKVQLGPASHAISLPGETRAWYESTIYARVSGYLAKWNVDIGDHVKAGQVLAVIDTPELDHQLVAAQAKEAALEAQVNLAQANMHFSETTLGRFKDAPKGVVSDLERDEHIADYQSSVSRVAAAEADLNSAKAEVENLQSVISFKEVRAPFDGTITERRVDIGDLVTAGSTANTTSLFRMSQSDQLRVFVDVPQDTAIDIHNGDDAVAVWNGQSFRGKVARNAQTISLSGKTLRIEVDVPNSKFTLLPGAYLQVTFHTSDAKPSVEVPASAMNFRSGGPAVAVVSDDGKISFHPVTISRDLGNVVELASGVSAGEHVALNVSNQIAEGDRVTATEVDDPAMPASHAAALTSEPGVAADVH